MISNYRWSNWWHQSHSNHFPGSVAVIMCPQPFRGGGDTSSLPNTATRSAHEVRLRGRLAIAPNACHRLSEEEGEGRRGGGRRDANLGWLETETDPSIIIAIWKRRFHALIDDEDDDVASTLDELLLANGTNPSIGGTVFHVKMLVMFWDSLRFK